MEFDISKTYTSVTADKIKKGSKGYFADSVGELLTAVAEEDDTRFGEILSIQSLHAERRFCKREGEFWFLFYLVEEPQEKKFRPYKDTDEMIEDFKRRYNSYGGWSGKDNPMYCPLIWVQTACGNKKLVTNIDNDSVYLQKWVSLPEFAEAYTYLDGSPCGIEEYL